MPFDLSRLTRLARTLRPLRLSQLAWRGRYALARRLPARPFARTGPDAASPDLLEHVLLDDFPAVPLPSGSSTSNDGDVLRRLAAGRFHHLHRTEHLGRPCPDWKLGRQDQHRLWTVTLHYHAWACDLAAAIRRGDRPAFASELFTGYVTDWIDRCHLAAPGARQLAWNAYAVATRIGWWVRSYVTLGAAWWAARPAFRSRFLASLWQQADYLAGHLEWDLRGNHLLRDAVGLAWAGRFFAARRTDWQSVLRRWLATADAIAREQLREQVLPDGGHFERSPMYHLHVMEDLRTLALLLSPPRQQAQPPDDPHHRARLGGSSILHYGTAAEQTPRPTELASVDALTGTFGQPLSPPALPLSPPRRQARPPADLIAAWARMAEFAAWMRHPDGQIPLFNDAAFNGAPTPDEVLAMGHSIGVACDPRPRSGGRHFPDTGLVVWHGWPWTVFFDVGAVGPDVQPGHAHADTLSLECSHRGRRLFVDPGTYAYDHDDRRRHDRSTAAHNTVTIDGRDSSEAWHIFRVGRRAKPRDVRVAFPPGGMVATAAHDGYRWLPGEPTHRRMVIVEADELRIIDRIDGRGEHLVEGGWLLAPEWIATAAGSGWTLRRVGCAHHHGTQPDGTHHHAEWWAQPTLPRHAAAPPLRVTITLSAPGELQLAARPAVYHPEFGLELHTTRLGWRCFGPLPMEVTTCISSS